MNAAIRVSAEMWAATPIPQDMGAILDEIGTEHWPNRPSAGYLLGNFFSEGRFFLFLVNLMAAIASALLLSSLGRKAEAGS